MSRTLALVPCKHDSLKCSIVILLPLFLIDILLVLDIDISLLTMSKTISKKISAKDSVAKPSGKPPPGNKNFGFEIEIRFYAIEDGDDTE